VRGKAWRVYLLAVALLCAVYFVFPGNHLLLWSPLGLSGAVAIGVGVRLHRPGQQLAWWLLSGALLAFITGDTLYNVMVDVLGMDNPFPSVADVFYLTMYPLVAAGLMLLVRGRTSRRERGSLLDALIVTTGMGFLSWIFLIEPYVRDGTLGLLERVVSIAYPLGDVLVLAMLARLVGGGGMRSPALRFLSLGAAGLLVSDVFYGLIQLHGTWATNGPVDLGWAVFYGAWGMAGLHPSMSQLGGRSLAPAADLPRIRLLPLAAASLLAPVTLIVEAARGTVQDAGTVAAFTILLSLLVLARLAGVVSEQRQSVARERALRSAAAELGGAVGRAQLYSAIVKSTLRLVRDVPASRAELHIGGGGRPTLVAAAGGGEPLAALSDRQLGGLSAAEPVHVDHEHDVVRVWLPFDEGESGLLGLRSPDGVTLEIVEALQAIAAQAALAVEGTELSEHLQRQRSEAHFRTLIQNASDVILVAGVGGELRYLSPSCERALGVPVERLGGRRVQDLVHPEDADRVTHLLDQIQGHPRSTHTTTDWRLAHVDGSHRAFEVLVSNLLEDDTVGGVVFTMRDVTERRALESELTHQAFHDSLTGLANRALFTDRAEHALARRTRMGGQVALLVLDLDDFKIINDTRGHSVGDDLLVTVGERITTALRSGDTAARLGGDEFAVLVENTDVAEVQALGERLLARLAEPFDLDGEPTRIGACIGIAVSERLEGVEVELAELMRRADVALYAGKEQGKNCVVVFHDDLHARMVQRIGARAALQRGLDYEEFVVLYQPIVALDTGRIVGAEALLRWEDPERGTVGPLEFVPLAEESGLIVPLGHWVMESACAQLAAWREQFTAIPLRIGVNVSGRQFHDGDLVSVVAECLSRHGLPEESVILEITESVLIREDDTVVGTLSALRSLGARIAIDDFGTGYSSLGYLRRFPTDILKIDRSFVEGLATGNPQDGTPARTVVSLARDLGLGLVAEGIQTAAQRDELWRMGCDLGQGYLYAPPLAAGELTAALAHGGGLGTPAEAVPSVETVGPPPMPTGPVGARRGPAGDVFSSNDSGMSR
jgi:diguanylate cyclase (GGDEF)-like protein/PAS domain S-box-containing protein